jgi:hypothetical protein
MIFLAVVGPGLITSNVDNDAGGIYTYSLAGAQFGYLLLWTLIPMTIILFVTEEMAARMGVVTGKGLSDLIREEFGFRVTFFLMLAVLAVALGNVLAEFAGVAASMELFGVSRYVSVPVAAALVWWLVVRGTARVASSIWPTYSPPCWPGPIGMRRPTARFGRLSSGTHSTCSCYWPWWVPRWRRGSTFTCSRPWWRRTFRGIGTGRRGPTSSWAV